MTTDSMLKQNNITKDRLLLVFEKLGRPISEPTLNKRLKDQKWSYSHVQLLKQLGVWIEPEYNLLTSKMIEYILGVRHEL